jgi:hypothetical protein
METMRSHRSGVKHRALTHLPAKIKVRKFSHSVLLVSRVKNKAVSDTFAKQGNEAVKEFGRLDPHVKTFAHDKDGQELMLN